MSILSVNLKHLYQRKACWLLGLFLGFFTLAILLAIIGTGKSRQGVLLAPALLMLYAGTFAAALSIHVLTKPFSYCLPGHRNVVRDFLFSVGLPMAFLWSLCFFFLTSLGFIETVLACLAAFLVFMIFYWIGAWVVFKFKNGVIILAFLPLFMYVNRFFKVSEFIVRIIWENPLPVILLGIVANVLAWRHWSRSDLARRYCDKLWMGAFDPWNKEKVKKLAAEREKKKPGLNSVSSGIERFFIAKISRAEGGSLRQYIWACLYKSFGVAISRCNRDWLRFFITILLTLCFIGYLGPFRNIMFFVLAIIAANMDLNVYSTLLTSGGRRERFWSALTLAAVTALISVLAMVLITILTMLLETLLPELMIKGETYIFHALDIKLFFIPFLMIPLVFIMRLIFHKNPIWTIFFGVIFSSPLFAFEMVRKSLSLSACIDFIALIVITLLVVCWGTFIAVLRYISMCRCLTENK
jgi:hypothetical protein